MGLACTLCRPPNDTSKSTDDPHKGLKTSVATKRFREEPRKVLARDESHVHTTTINSFPENVLLEIFDFYRRDQDLYGSHFHSIWDWPRLAHVCPRWRRIIFSSPRRLDLQLLCTYGTPVRKNLGCWPPLPLIIDYCSYRGADDGKSLTPSDEDNIVAALENSARTRICPSFPMNSWVDLPQLLASSISDFWNIPHGGYISPEAMVASLAALTGLRTLFIGFRSPTPPSIPRRQGPVTRAGLPSLTTFGFHGVKEYLEDLVAQIDTPRLDYFRISYFNQLDFQVPRLSKFICRTQNLYLAQFQHARIDFGVSNVYVSLYCEREELLESHFSLQISCRGLDWQVSHVAEILSQSAAILSNVGDLSIDARDLPSGEKDYMDGTEWLDLFRPFVAVDTLHVSGKLAGHVAHGLEGVTEEMVAEILPALRSLCLEEEPLTSVERFVEVRRFSCRPITVVNAPGEFSERLESPSELERVPYPSTLNIGLQPARWSSPPTTKKYSTSVEWNTMVMGLTSAPHWNGADWYTYVKGGDISKNLGYWPPFPLIIDYYTYWGDGDGKKLNLDDEDDVIAAVENPDRVRYVGVSVTRSLLGKMAAVMQEPFPMLTHLWLSLKDGNVPVIPETFLGASAPSLRVVHLEGIPFLALPTLLSSATDLVDLQLQNIPNAGYVSPDAMIAGLAALTRLETLSIGFQSPTPLPDPRSLPPLTRIPLASLTTFNFRGVSEYLEDLVAQIDTPLLKNFTIMYFNQLSFQIPRLSQFIGRTESLDLSRLKHARFDFGSNNVYVRLGCDQAEQLEFTLQISCQRLEWQVSHMAQLLSQCFPIATLSSVDKLSIECAGSTTWLGRRRGPHPNGRGFSARSLL
ncbi:hypothetical protein BJY52DRAFT_1190522 [Lactarius psammicola]|nr:hypothetical protein BJY52DRAFT_1190522 [Lactarius psammicola]